MPTTSAADRTAIHRWTEWPQIAPVWSRLVESARHCSFFLTREWVETWLEVYGPSLQPNILVVYRSSTPVAAALLVRSRASRALIPVDCVSLNTSGEAPADTAYSEYNDVLCLEGFEQDVAAEIAACMLSRPADEIVLTNFTDSVVYRSLKTALVAHQLEEHAGRSSFVNLARLREEGKPYIESLGKKVRKHLRQDIRAYSQCGELKVERAASPGAAQAMLEEMAELSQQRWAALGKRGMFSSKLFRRFCDNLVRRCAGEAPVDQGSVHLLRVSAGGKTVGIVLNLIYLGRVYFYQCGYKYTEDGRLSPGTVTLSQVIQYYMDAGYLEFDMLSGEGKYKQLLSNDHRPVFKATCRHSGMKTSAILYLRKINGKLMNR